MTQPAAETVHRQPAQPVWQHGQALANGVRLHFVEAGAGPLVIFLHGFPEFWYSWRHQIPAVAAAGFHAVAPDLRGFNESDKPAGIANYRLSVLVEDVVGLIGHFDARRAVLVGHDWGGGVAWATAMARPDLVRRLVVLNAPHPAAFRRELRKPQQRLRSLYMRFFQLPCLPELAFRAGNYFLLEHTLRRQPVRPGAFTRGDIRLYKNAMARPGALTAALNYYRALFRFRREATRAVGPIDVPALLIWGEQDPYLGVRLTHGLGAWVRNLRVERRADASHWVQNDAPAWVNDLLLDFLRPEHG